MACTDASLRSHEQVRDAWEYHVAVYLDAREVILPFAWDNHRNHVLAIGARGWSFPLVDDRGMCMDCRVPSRPCRIVGYFRRRTRHHQNWRHECPYSSVICPLPRGASEVMGLRAQQRAGGQMQRIWSRYFQEMEHLHGATPVG